MTTGCTVGWRGVPSHSPTKLQSPAAEPQAPNANSLTGAVGLTDTRWRQRRWRRDQQNECTLDAPWEPSNEAVGPSLRPCRRPPVGRNSVDGKLHNFSGKLRTPCFSARLLLLSTGHVVEHMARQQEGIMGRWLGLHERQPGKTKLIFVNFFRRLLRVRCVCDCT